MYYFPTHLLGMVEMRWLELPAGARLARTSQGRARASCSCAAGSWQLEPAAAAVLQWCAGCSSTPTNNKAALLAMITLAPPHHPTSPTSPLPLLQFPNN